jgi:2-polyprenyl-6-hydroxyphenyl methylase/3-demethylubiquinone-9 3-methyltransferase
MNLTTDYFTDDTENFAANYSIKPSFRDRLHLFESAVRRAASPPAKVLDFGCGPGVIASAIARMGFEVLGTDGSEGMVSRCNQEVSAEGLGNLRFEVMDASAANFAAESFDVIVCSSVLEYLPDDKYILEVLVGSLREGGTLIISVPNAWSIVGMMERSIRWLRRSSCLDIGRHFDYSLRHYSTSNFSSLLERSGLQVVGQTSFEFPWFGAVGIGLSRLRCVGAMRLYEARRMP